jgi:hypothetical protein
MCWLGWSAGVLGVANPARLVSTPTWVITGTSINSRLHSHLMIVYIVKKGLAIFLSPAAGCH